MAFYYVDFFFFGRLICLSKLMRIKKFIIYKLLGFKTLGTNVLELHFVYVGKPW